jgi:class 3 adenylate cyclase
MVTKAELTDYINKTIVTEPWTVDEGRVVPATSDIALNNSARRFELATFLYADLNGSTKMVEEHGWGRSAEIYKTYLYCASRLIRHFDGEVVAFDGDRVMNAYGRLETTASSTGRIGTGACEGTALPVQSNWVPRPLTN